ncbi:glycerophosphodiester phosphodiesterase [Caenimonas terrae]|uniref:Glycerophosphodiester phosphodiesterase n=1 Tax=Caenimonas terrae TaxID=696074 RepID=A0ABW0NCG9_9BURK
MRPLILLTLLLGLAGPALAFDLQAHRGGRGLMPENTLPAFENAIALGVTTLELDIALTADGVVVISHDPSLNPLIVRDPSGHWFDKGPAIRSMTFAQLQTYRLGRIRPDTPYAASFPEQQSRDGVRMPTLAALFDRVKALGATDVRFNIETKVEPGTGPESPSPEEVTRAILRVVRDAGMTARVSLQSFDWRTLQLAQKLEPRIPTVYLTSQTARFDTIGDGRWTAGFRLADHGSVPRMVKAAGGSAWSPYSSTLTEAQVKEAHALGLKVIPWTVNLPGDFDRLLDWGVDGIITDYPDRLREAMRRHNIALPRPVPVPAR